MSNDPDYEQTQKDRRAHLRAQQRATKVVVPPHETIQLLVGAADWIMREVVYHESRTGVEQTHARAMAKAVRDQAAKLLDA